MERFPDLARRLMARRQLSQRAMAQATGVSQSYVAQVLRGARPLAEEHVAAWSRLLRPGGVEQIREFRVSAALERCPDEVREHVELLERRLAYTDQQLSARAGAAPRRRR